MKRITLCILVGSALAGCAPVRPSMSYVAPTVTAHDAQVLAADAAQWLAGPLPPAQTTIVIEPPAAGQTDVMTQAMTNHFRATGYGVVQAPPRPPKNAPLPKGVTLRYLVSALNSGVLLRLQYQGAEATKYYARSARGALIEAGPFTVRQGGAATTTNGIKSREMTLKELAQ